VSVIDAICETLELEVALTAPSGSLDENRIG
jgi:hypothetical protein